LGISRPPFIFNDYRASEIDAATRSFPISIARGLKALRASRFRRLLATGFRFGAVFLARGICLLLS
jgi:hypothetical protein